MVTRGLRQALDPLVEAEAVGDDEPRVAEAPGVGGAGLVIVGVGACAHEGRHGNTFSPDAADEVAEDAEARDHFERRGAQRRGGECKTERERGEEGDFQMIHRYCDDRAVQDSRCGRRSSRAPSMPPGASASDSR